MNPERLDELQQRLSDCRSRRVIFVSHCLLNQNVRYLGGACRPGAIDELVDSWQREGIGICQMPCPEQRAWGGALKRGIAPAYGSKGTWMWPLRGIALATFSIYTGVRYRLLSRRVANEIRDYLRSGFEVVGVMGVAGSPSCGVNTTLDVRAWLEAAGRMKGAALNSAALEQTAIAPSTRPGRGWFVKALSRRLAASVAFSEAELTAGHARILRP